ncbi:MAG TPA: GtrA family protein [Trebonia sp.]|nr:GtrA family protein [Trebonia sp.]
MAHAHQARYAAAMATAARRLPFGLSRVVPPSLLGYLLINLCTFCLDLGILAVAHGVLRWPLPLSVTLSYGTASLTSYLLNRVLNFQSHAAVGRQLPLFIAVSISNYLVFVLGGVDLLAAIGIYFELARVIAACCEAAYLYTMMRFVVFRDTHPDADAASARDAADAAKTADGTTGDKAAAPGQSRKATVRDSR